MTTKITTTPPSGVVVTPQNHPVNVVTGPSRPVEVTTGNSPGPPGPQGPPGPPGGGVAGGYYVHSQAVPTATWVVAHGLHYFPNVTVIDTQGNQIQGDVHYDSAEQLTVTFSAGFAGEAYLS